MAGFVRYNHFNDSTATQHCRGWHAPQTHDSQFRTPVSNSKSGFGCTDSLHTTSPDHVWSRLRLTGPSLTVLPLTAGFSLTLALLLFLPLASLVHTCITSCITRVSLITRACIHHFMHCSCLARHSCSSCTPAARLKKPTQLLLHQTPSSGCFRPPESPTPRVRRRGGCESLRCG